MFFEVSVLFGLALTNTMATIKYYNFLISLLEAIDTH